VDAIEEFNVITNNPPADYGQFMGGVISVITKSGTTLTMAMRLSSFRNND